MNTTLDLPAVNRVLTRAHKLGHFKKKYGQLAPVTSPEDFLHIPLMNKADLVAATGELRRLARQEGRNMYLFASGGTTGQPRFGLLHPSLLIDDIIRYWKPLSDDDVMLNMLRAGKLWSGHYFYNALGARLAAEIIPVGSIDATDFVVWLHFIQEQGITALVATPTKLKELLGFCEQHQHALPGVRKLLWTGEPCDGELTRLVSLVVPHAKIWGLYGSNETWVIGYNSPDCPFDTFHVLPYQFLEISEHGELILTNTNPHCINTLLRYQVGDAAAWTTCRCQQTTQAIRVLGRIDDNFKIRGSIIDPGDLARLAKEAAGGSAVQVAIIPAAGARKRIELRVVTHDPDDQQLQKIRQYVLEHSVSLNKADLSPDDPDPGHPDEFRVVAVPRLHVNPRTDKTPLVLWEEP